MTQEPHNEELIRKLINVVINDHEIDAVHDMCADDLVVSGAGSTFHGSDEFEGFLRGVDAAFPDFAFEVEDLLVDDDKVAFHVTVTGTHEGEFEGIPPTGEEFSYPSIFIATIEDGEVSELVYESDRVSLMQQLGVMD